MNISREAAGEVWGLITLGSERVRKGHALLWRRTLECLVTLAAGTGERICTNAVKSAFPFGFHTSASIMARLGVALGYALWVRKDKPIPSHEIKNTWHARNWSQRYCWVFFSGDLWSSLRSQRTHSRRWNYHNPTPFAKLPLHFKRFREVKFQNFPGGHACSWTP